jgi:hypothetical protein
LKINTFYPSHGHSVIGADLVAQEITKSIENAKKELHAFVNRIKSKSLGKARPPPSLYNREKEDL